MKQQSRARFRATWLVAALLLATLGARATGPARGSEIHGKVVQVKDGDSMVVRAGGENVGVRTFGVDCPERGMPWSGKAKTFTSTLVGNRDVTVVVHDVDRYGRVVGDVVLADGRSLARELLRAGLAWYYRRYANEPEYDKLESDARAAKRGLWSEPNPIPPWQFRAARRAP
jgi:endonuclease YncB( thermonuclease family)